MEIQIFSLTKDSKPDWHHNLLSHAWCAHKFTSPFHASSPSDMANDSGLPRLMGLHRYHKHLATISNDEIIEISCRKVLEWYLSLMKSPLFSCENVKVHPLFWGI